MRRKLVLAATLTMITCALGCGRFVGSGERIGTIVKLSQEGILNKTWEIEIVRGGLNAGQGGFGVKPFYATVPEKYKSTLLPQLQDAFNRQIEVKIGYDEYLGTLIASECAGEDEGCAFVRDVTPYTGN